jgi:hypothetical protein
LGPGRVEAPALPFSPIHRSAWKDNSTNFDLMEWKFASGRMATPDSTSLNATFAGV